MPELGFYTNNLSTGLVTFTVYLSRQVFAAAAHIYYEQTVGCPDIKEMRMPLLTQWILRCGLKLKRHILSGARWRRQDSCILIFTTLDTLYHPALLCCDWFSAQESLNPTLLLDCVYPLPTTCMASSADKRINLWAATFALYLRDAHDSLQ